ncbi:MAG: hypothetical protein HFJ02_02675 [Bacilli bacterium]|nr:hypothetical protein [Bacilli bacterium]
MDKKFKKCFDTTYNNKVFTIFVDEFHRYTFLEKNKEGNYLYPTLEEYKALNKIYNEHNPFVLPSVKEYTFKEKVKVGALTLAISLVLSACGKEELPQETTTWTIEAETEAKTENEVITVIQKTPEYHEITSLEEWTTIFKIPPVTLEDIDKVIASNSKLDDYFKSLAHNLAEAIYKNEPNADLRIYYLNLQTLDVEAMSDEKYTEIFKDYSQACYEPKKNKINYKMKSDEETLYHELAHTTFTFYREIDGNIYYRGGTNTRALNEAFNNRIVGYVTPTHSYNELGSVLDYLFVFVPYDYNRYNNEGPMYILNDLKKMYPDINISYINDCVNAMMDSFRYSGNYIKIEDSESLVDSLIALSNEKLSENDLEMKVYPYKEVIGLIFDGEKVYPYIKQDRGADFTIIENDVVQEKTFYTYITYEINPVYLELLLRKELIKNPNLEMNPDFWKHYAIDSDTMSPGSLYKTSIFLNGALLGEEKISNLRIQAGETETGELGFIITNSVSETIIYQSHNDLKNISNVVFFDEYYSLDKTNFEKLELREILNEEYLKEIMIQKDLFKNVFITGNALKFEPLLTYYVTDEKGERHKFNLNRQYFGEKDIYFKDILKYYGLLEETKTEYYFTSQEINEIIASYMEEQQKNAKR